MYEPVYIWFSQIGDFVEQGQLFKEKVIQKSGLKSLP